MKLPRDLSGRELAQALKKAFGYEITRETGNHRTRLKGSALVRYRLSIGYSNPACRNAGSIASRSASVPPCRETSLRQCCRITSAVRSITRSASATVRPNRGAADVRFSRHAARPWRPHTSAKLRS